MFNFKILKSKQCLIAITFNNNLLQVLQHYVNFCKNTKSNGNISAGARAFEVGGPNLKVGGRGTRFLLIFALEKHTVHNAVTSINNSLVQSEIWCSKFKIAFSRNISVIISNKILLTSARRSEGAL